MIPSEKLTDVTEAGIRRPIDHGVPVMMRASRPALRYEARSTPA